MLKVRWIVLLLAAGLTCQAAFARGGYTRVEIEQACRNEGRNTGLGALLGIGTALLLGADQLQDILSGGVAGALLGHSMSCRDKVRYVQHYDSYMDRWDHSRYDYNSRREDRLVCFDGGMCGEVVREGFRRGESCRTMAMENRRGNVQLVTVCRPSRGGGQWRHYDDDHSYEEERWVHPNMTPQIRVQVDIYRRPTNPRPSPYRPEYGRPDYGRPDYGPRGRPPVLEYPDQPPSRGMRY